MKEKVLIVLFLLADFILVLWLLVHNNSFQVLSPAGSISVQERNLIVFAFLLAMVVVVPVLASFFFIAWKYRADNHRAHYTPEWSGNKKLMLLWWAIPLCFILILSVVMWRETHLLDPYKPIQSNKKPVTIQVVALRWKWLFIYPEEHIATVNFIEIPEKTPINFQLTANAPMNSFWIPRLGGQIYAMPGMNTQTHYLANTTGEFQGSAAEINGKGFAGMRFTTKSVSEQEYKNWVQSNQQSGKQLTFQTYQKLAEPSENVKTALYSPVDANLYNQIVNRYMPKNSEMSGMQM